MNDHVELCLGEDLLQLRGIADVCLSFPMLLDRRGATLMAYPILAKAEQEGLRASASTIKHVVDGIRGPSR